MLLSKESVVSQEVHNNAIEEYENIAKVANVEVKLTAILGRATLPLKDIIEFDSGSIIPLNNFTYDPIEIFVNDIYIAKAKVVAIEDTYGVKILEIVDNNKEK